MFLALVLWCAVAPRQSTTPDPNPFNATHPVQADPGVPPTFSVGERIHFSHCPNGDTKPTLGVDTQFSGFRGHPEFAHQPPHS